MGGNVNACEERAHDNPPGDVVVFGVHDPVESSDEFADCSDGGDDVDVSELLDRILVSEGFVPGTL
jgi:hypothetical protein